MKVVQLDKRIQPAISLGEEIFSNAHSLLKTTVMRVSAETVDIIIEVSVSGVDNSFNLYCCDP